MKIRIVSNRDKMDNVKGEQAVHLSFRPSMKDIFTLHKKNPALKVLELPPAHAKVVTNNAAAYLRMNNIELICGNRWGHRVDIDTYDEMGANGNETGIKTGSRPKTQGTYKGTAQ